MAISQIELEKQLWKLFDTESREEGGQAESIQRIAHGLAKAVAEQIEQGVNTATVTHLLTSESGEKITGEITLNTNIEDE